MGDELWRQIILGDGHHMRHLPQLVVVAHSCDFRLSHLPPGSTLGYVPRIHPTKMLCVHIPRLAFRTPSDSTGFWDPASHTLPQQRTVAAPEPGA